MSDFRDLDVYKKAYRLSMEIFFISKSFPKEELYSLTDQIRRSSRSICSNIAEGYRKRYYPKHFRLKITDSDAECSETIVWIHYSYDCRYLSKDKFHYLIKEYESVGEMLGAMILNPDKFTPKSQKI